MAKFPVEAELPLQELEGLKQDLKCKVCTMMFEDPMTLHCGHVLCKECAMENIHTNTSCCPFCREYYTRRGLHPALPIETAVAYLKELGVQLGVADISATQGASQPFVFKPFVPLQRPKLPAFSQALREAKSQMPDFSDSGDESSDESSEMSLVPTCPLGHTLRRSPSKGWRCSTHQLLGSCASGMAKPCERRRDSWTCEECGYFLCVTCFNKFPKEVQAKQARLAAQRTQSATNGTEDMEVDSDSDSSSSSSSGSDTDSDSSSSDDTERCVLCNVAGDSQMEGCKKLLEMVGAHADRGRISDGLLGAADASVVSAELGPLEGPFTVTWRVGIYKEGTKTSTTVRKEAKAHDICLLWCPQTKVSKNGKVSAHTVPAAVRNARNKECTACGNWGASLSCAHSGCRKAFHVPCGLFTSAIGRVDEESFTVYCEEHSGAAGHGPAA